MLQWFQNFFVSIASTIESLISLVFSLIQSLFDLIKMLPTMITITTSAIGFLPDMVMLFATLSITVSVIYLMVGRNNN